MSHEFRGIKLFDRDSCYNNGLWGERRVVFRVSHYLIKPDGTDKDDGRRIRLRVGFGSHVCEANIRDAGWYADLREVVVAMCMMLGNFELRYEYGGVLTDPDTMRWVRTNINPEIELSFA